MEGGSMLRNLEPAYDMAYGYIKVKTGEEEKTVRIIRAAFPNMDVHVIMQIKHRSCNGIRSYATDIMIPGYLLLRSGRE